MRTCEHETLRPDKLLSASGLARVLGVAEPTVRRWVAAGLLAPDFEARNAGEATRSFWLESRLPELQAIAAKHMEERYARA